MSQISNYLGNFGNQLGSQIGNYLFPPEDPSQVQIPDGTQIDHTLPSGRAKNLPPGFSGQTVEAGQFFDMPNVSSQSFQVNVPGFSGQSSQVSIPGFSGQTVEAGQYFEPEQVKRETDSRYTDLAKTLAQSNYFIANDIDQAVQIPVEDRDQFLRELYNESVKQKERNKDRGILAGVWDNFSLGRGNAYTSIMSLPNTLGYERVPDEEVQFVNDIMSIRSQVTDPENQNWFQYGAEGAARMAPDLLSMLAIGTAGGPYAAASFSAARTAPDLEQAMVDLDVNPSIRKPLAVVGAIPIAALELVGAGAVFRPLKTQAVKRVQDAVARKTAELVGKKGTKYLGAAGNYASDLTVEMTQEFAQGITEASVTSFGKVLQEGGFTEEATKAAKQQYTSNIASVLDATLPMAFLVGGGRMMERIVNIPQDLGFVKEEDIPQVKKFIEENPEEVQRILESSDGLSRKDMEKIGIEKTTNAKQRGKFKDDLRKIVKANQYDFSQLFSGAPVTPSMDIDQAVRNQLGQNKTVSGVPAVTPSMDIDQAVRDQLGDQRQQPQEEYGPFPEAEFEDAGDLDYYTEDPNDAIDTRYGMSEEDMAMMEYWDTYKKEVNTIGPNPEENMVSLEGFDPRTLDADIERWYADEQRAIEERLKKEKGTSLNKMVEEYDLELGKEKTNAAKRAAIANKEIEITRLALEAHITPNQLKAFVNDQWNVDQSQNVEEPFQEEMENFLKLYPDKKFKEDLDKVKNLKKREAMMVRDGLFGTGIDIHEMSYNRLRTLVSRLRKATKTDPVTGSRPTQKQLQSEAFSLLQTKDIWSKIDESEFAARLADSGKVPPEYQPADYARKLILDYLGQKIDMPSKWSYDYVSSVADLFKDNDYYHEEAKAEGEKFGMIRIKFLGEGGYPDEKWVAKDKVTPQQLKEHDFIDQGGLLTGSTLSAASVLGRKPSRKFDPAEQFLAMSMGPKQKTALDVNRGVEKASFWQLLTAKVKKRYNQLTRRYEYLDMSKAESRVARQLLRVLQGKIGNAARYVESMLKAITEDLPLSELKILERLLIYEDMWAQYEATGDPRVSFRFKNDGPLSVQKVKDTLDFLRTAPDNFPRVGEALDRRRRLYKPIVEKLVEKKLLPEEALDDINKYIHRMVMIHQRGSKQYMEYLKKMGKETLGVTDKAGQIQSQIIESVRGYQISRRTDKDMQTSDLYSHNTHLIETDFDWLSNALTQLEILDFLDNVDKRLNVAPQLKAQANRENMVAWLGGQAKYDEIMEKRSEGAYIDRQKRTGEIDSKEYREKRMPITKWLEENDPANPYNRRMARAIASAKEALGIDAEDYSIDWNRMFNEIKETQPDSIVNAFGAQYFKAKGEREAQMKEDLGTVDFQTVEKIVDRDGKYDFFLPGPGSRFYTALSISDEVGAWLQQEILEGNDVDPNEIKVKEILAMTSAEKMVLPTDIANEFNSMKNEEDYSWALTTEWKKSVLLAPFRLPGYMIRNFFGDSEATIQGLFGDMKVGNWAKSWNIASRIKKANEEIVKYRAKGMKLPAKLKAEEKLINDLLNYDVVGSSRIQQDLELDPEMRKFARTDGKSILGKPGDYYNRYMNAAGRLAELAENQRRIFAFLEFRDMLRRHETKGDPINYGASNRALIDTTLREFGPDAAAAQLARDLSGDYGETTVAVAKLSKNWMPFAKFQGINLEREVRLFVNNLYGLITATKAQKPKHAAMLLARMIKPALAYALWNSWMFPDEEEDLSAYDRANPHVILGRREDGSVIIARNFSTTGDFFEWFGLNSLPHLMRMAYDGQITKADVIKEASKDPLNKLIGSITPVVKMPLEALVGMTLFPDATNPRSAERGEIIASTVMNKETFKSIRGYVMGTGETGRPGNFAWQAYLGGSVSDPMANMLNDTYSLIDRFKDSKGIPSANYSASPTRDMKRAVQFGDEDAFRKAKAYFVANGGDSEKFLNSIRNYDPVDRLSDEDEKEFMTEFLNQYQARRVEVSRDYAKRLQAQMWRLWSEDEKVRTGSVPPKFTSRIASKMSSLSAKHREPTNSKGVPWQVEYEQTAEWMKERGITASQAIASLREKLIKDRTPLSSIAPKLRMARARLKEMGIQ